MFLNTFQLTQMSSNKYNPSKDHWVYPYFEHQTLWRSTLYFDLFFAAEAPPTEQDTDISFSSHHAIQRCALWQCAFNI